MRCRTASDRCRLRLTQVVGRPISNGVCQTVTDRHGLTHVSECQTCVRLSNKTMCHTVWQTISQPAVQLRARAGDPRYVRPWQ